LARGLLLRPRRLLQRKREEARLECDRSRAQIVSTTQAGRQHECILWAGQTAGGIKEVIPVAAIMRRVIEDAEAALLRAPAFVKAPSQQAAE
jgi:NAD(P)H-dependent flavin oxidoreductase YrpB (nitropropane dioxygenase family)